MCMDELDVLALKFFKLFAEYEYELKSQGYYYQTGAQGVNADFDRFANEKIGNDYPRILGDDKESAKYILENPPMKQIVEHSSVKWKEVSTNDTSIQALFGHIRRVRNNLYHGAKFSTTWFDPVRSQKLISHSLKVLNACKDKLYS